MLMSSERCLTDGEIALHSFLENGSSLAHLSREWNDQHVRKAVSRKERLRRHKAKCTVHLLQALKTRKTFQQFLHRQCSLDPFFLGFALPFLWWCGQSLRLQMRIGLAAGAV